MKLCATGLKKSFDGKTDILKGIDLTVNDGEFISILGASGSGKSTLLTILGGMDRATDGKVVLDGVELNTLKEKELAILRRTKVGFVFQFFNLAPYLTVQENIKLPLILDGKNVKEYTEKFDFLIKYLKIEHILDKMPAELSGGEQQRTAIARALIYQPSIIFLDEPTGNLDSESSEEIMLLLQKINKDLKTTVLQVTHSETNAEYGSRIIKIKDGRIISDIMVEREEISEEMPFLANSEEEVLPTETSTAEAVLTNVTNTDDAVLPTVTGEENLTTTEKSNKEE